MPDYNPESKKIITKIDELVEKGLDYLGDSLPNYYGSTLDGSDVAEYMQSIGFRVVTHYDTGSCGLTLINYRGYCVTVSTNGFCRVESKNQN